MALGHAVSVKSVAGSYAICSRAMHVDAIRLKQIPVPFGFRRCLARLQNPDLA